MDGGGPNYTLTPRPRMGSAAILAIASSLASLVVSCSGHPFWGLTLAIVAAPLGLLRILRSVSPAVRGGFVSFAAIALSLFGMVVAIIVLVFKIPAWFFA